MRYRVFSGPPGSGAVSPLEKERLLFKEFDSLDAPWRGRITCRRTAASRCRLMATTGRA